MRKLYSLEATIYLQCGDEIRQVAAFIGEAIILTEKNGRFKVTAAPGLSLDEPQVIEMKLDNIRAIQEISE